MIKFDTDCPNCGSSNTSFVPETAYDRDCDDCDTRFDIRPNWLIEEDNLYLS